MTEAELIKKGCSCGSKAFIQLDANEFECSNCEKVYKVTKHYEQTYGSYLKLVGAIAHFFDDMCGELDANTVDEQEIKWFEDSYESVVTFSNGETYDISISFNDEEDDCWYCQAFLKQI